MLYQSPNMTSILDYYSRTRQHTLNLCQDLESEDFNLQGAEFTSPVKWHLAHTTWFFETMILQKFLPTFAVFNEQFAYLFNSYYNTLGERVARNNRGMLSRPYVSEVFNYRDYVDQHMCKLLENHTDEKLIALVILGLQHEEQHQELLQSDLKYALFLNPFNFQHKDFSATSESKGSPAEWKKIKEGIYEIGHKGTGFCFDNELNRHKVYLESFEISKNLVKNAEFIEFIEDGGYANFHHWLDEGWAWVNSQDIKAPLYWRKTAQGWMNFTTKGFKPIDPEDFVTHISLYESMAFASWKGMRLATEFEWEAAADEISWGSRWEWTNSAYLPYPGFQIAPGAVGEYNGKFMSNQMVLRGASVATSKGHSRKSYRNFFHSNAQWQFTGIRLVK
ncbi:ergothioneine biosynthesis protein EgtB [Lutimonas sp.]|uniref:ergothioneine biosynthesis protein EgtB n=1 Tax=Lutimonas sp. TaxID=1872403 RepID=UPI003D9BDAB1